MEDRTHVPDKLEGYLLQVRHALYELISLDDRIVSVEAFDDVATEINSEIGSASNWLSYHIATILAFQQFFQTKGKVAMPNFVIFDQPSQAYFPQHTKIVTDENLEYRDEDKEAVKKIFTCFETFLKQIGESMQIIVTEHADEDIWGDIKSAHLVARWRGEEKLIPQAWL